MVIRGGWITYEDRGLARKPTSNGNSISQQTGRNILMVLRENAAHKTFLIQLGKVTWGGRGDVTNRLCAPAHSSRNHREN